MTLFSPSGLEAPPPFDVCGDLPKGVTVLEASAGTGKTFTIASLATRYVAEGIPLAELLIVTFTRNATGELRDRVRQRLVSAEVGLDRVLRGGAVDEHDAVLGLLATGTTDEVRLRWRRLSEALAGFDAATIVTTHGFCQHVLDGLGVAGDVERGATFVEITEELVNEVVDDFYVRKFAPSGREPAFTRTTAFDIANVAVKNFWAPLEPADTADGIDKLRVSLAGKVREEVEARKRKAGVLTYDDLLSRLRDTLAHPETGDAACRRLRARYRVALVDEFQDTDPVQWEILDRAFRPRPGPERAIEEQATLVLIGDPKQAIYAFRGADVYAYLEAAKSAATEATLGVNWRSDQGLIDAYDALFRNAQFGHEGIAYRTVEAAPPNQEPRLLGAPVSAPLRFRVVHREDPWVKQTNYGYVVTSPAREIIAADLAADIVDLLSSGATINRRGTDGASKGSEEIAPGHIAVLVRKNRDAALVRDALEKVGVSAVINGAGSVFGAPVASEWLRLLEALERPTSRPRAHSAALTPFIGWSAERVASASEDEWEDVHARLHRWAGVLRRRGVASLQETITISEGLPARMLARVDGERQLTDLRHIGQLLHAEAAAGQLGVTALTTWLRLRLAEVAVDTENEERSRRLESDAEAVQVLTIHRSKGLEFPVVYLPYLWDSWIPDDAAPIFHDAANGDRRTVYVGAPKTPDYDRHFNLYQAEQRAEELRLAYVALTRAQHQAVVWWAGVSGSGNSSIGRLLFSKKPDGTIPAEGGKVPPDKDVMARLDLLAAEAPGCVSVERAGAPARGRKWDAPQRPVADLSAGSFDRVLDTLWRRTSYSAITSADHDARVASEPEETVTVDEPADAIAPVPMGGGRPGAVDPVASHGAAAGPRLGPGVGGSAGGGDEGDLRRVPAILSSMPGGVDVGTAVHSILEHVEFDSAELDRDVAEGVAAEIARRQVDLGDPAVTAAGLRAVIRTPLGPLVGDRPLSSFGRADRLDELHFELPLVGGDHPSADLDVATIGTLLRRHIPAGSPLSGYADRFDSPALAQTLRGYLSGSLDVVLRDRAAGPGGADRFVVVDHKTNWLGSGDEPLTAWDYRPEAMAHAMMHHHYPLQALLYSVALHRYLRWRLPTYDPDANLAGILYLFLRGMSGPDVPRVAGHPCGVFAWRPPTGLVLDLSDLLDQGSASVAA